MSSNRNISDFEVDFKEISARIRQLRLNAGYTQEFLSEQAGYSPSYLYQVEHGFRKPSVLSLAKFSLFFGVSLDYLVTGKTRPDADNLELLLNTLTSQQRENIYIALNSVINPKNK